MERISLKDFTTSMAELSMAFSAELSELRLGVYWRALQDLPIGAVRWACVEASKFELKFPVPGTLRLYAVQYLETAREAARQAANRGLPQWSTAPDPVALEYIHKVLDRLELQDAMTPRHTVYVAPSTEDPAARRARLIAQGLGLMARAQQQEEEPL